MFTLKKKKQNYLIPCNIIYVGNLRDHQKPTEISEFCKFEGYKFKYKNKVCSM